VVDAHPGELLDGLDEQGRPAERERRVDLVLAVPGDGHPGVARDGDDRDIPAVPGDVDEHDRVGALRAGGPPAGVPAGGPAVRADDEDVHGRRRERPSLAPGEPGRGRGRTLGQRRERVVDARDRSIDAGVNKPGAACHAGEQGSEHDQRDDQRDLGGVPAVVRW
jgi:hypothetical protein